MNRFTRKILIAVMFVGASTWAGVAAAQELQREPATCVLVYGAVKTETRFELKRAARLSEVIALAGGPTTFASGVVQVRREVGCADQEVRLTFARAGRPKGPRSIETYKLANVNTESEKFNPLLLPGDHVFLELLPAVYVIGNVRNPQALTLREGMTVSQAIAAAGGPLPDSNSDRFRVFRIHPDEIITVNLTLIKKRPDLDFKLQLNDIIEMPAKHPSDPMPNGWLLRIVEQKLPVRVIE